MRRFILWFFFYTGDYFKLSSFRLGAPRRSSTEEQSSILNIAINEGLFSVQLTAYPTPTVKNTLYLGQYNDNSTEGTPAWNKFYVACEANSFLPASVICNITTINMANADEGFFKVIFSNELGELPLILLVRRDGKLNK